MVQHYESLAQEAARDQLGHVEYLGRLADIESAARYERSVARRIKQARLPVIKTLEQFRWSWPSKINRAQVQDLFRLRFIEQNLNVVLMGNASSTTTRPSPQPFSTAFYITARPSKSRAKATA